MSPNLNPLLIPRRRAAPPPAGPLPGFVPLGYDSKTAWEEVSLSEPAYHLLGGILESDKDIASWLSNEQAEDAPAIMGLLSGKRIAVIDMVRVAYDRRGEGLGAKAFNRLLWRARRAKCDAILLLSGVYEKQRRGFNITKFWEARGFERIGQTVGAVDKGEKPRKLPLMVRWLKPLPKTAKLIEYGQLKNILSELMADVEGNLPTPDLRIVSHTRPTWGGRCLWTLGNPNTVIEIQKSVTADERSFRRILAHELCHHEQYLVYWSVYTPRNFKFMTRLEGGHGRVFRKIMDRWNARHGKGFVTVTSDKDILYEFESKPFFVFVQRFLGGRPIWQASIRLTDRQLRFMSGKRQGDYKLVQTDDRRFINAPVIGSGKGWQYIPVEEHEWEEAAIRLWEQPDLRMRWDAKPPATKEEEQALQRQRDEEEREARRRRYEELAASIGRHGMPPTTAASRDTAPTPEVLEEARQIRAKEREGDSSSAQLMAGNCGNTATAAADRFGWDIESGIYIHEGRGQDHTWNILADGTVVDISHDRFGEPDIAVARPGTTEHARYHPYCWAYKPQEEADACPVCNPPGAMAKDMAKAGDSHKQTPHRENEFPDLDEGEAVGGYGTQPECVEGNRTGLGIEELARQVEMTEVLDGT